MPSEALRASAPTRPYASSAPSAHLAKASRASRARPPTKAGGFGDCPPLDSVLRTKEGPRKPRGCPKSALQPGHCVTRHDGTSHKPL